MRVKITTDRLIHETLTLVSKHVFIFRQEPVKLGNTSWCFKILKYQKLMS